MVFNTIFFIIVYLPLVLVIYHAIPGKFHAARNVVLLVSSILFYAWGEPVYVLLLLYSAICNFLLGRDIEKKLALNRPKAAGKSVVFGIVLNGFILCFFKYFNFLVASLGMLFRTTLNCKELPVPIGVSFFTLQAIAYLLEIWEGTGTAIGNPVEFGLYLMMFPKLLAGPVVTLEEMQAQLHARKESFATVGAGFSRFTVGLAKKLILADTIGIVWENIAAFPPAELSMLTAWIGAFAYGFRLYFEFSGYADMAIGLGGMFGFVLPENYMYPFTAKSVTEFWRRFNITVYRWFRERILVPLGGTTGTLGRRARALFMTWVLIGLWYGASWHHVVWGAMMGLILVLERYAYGKHLQKFPGVVRQIYMVVILTITWAMFAKDSVLDGFRYMGVLFGGSDKLIDSASWYYLRTNLLLFVVMIAAVLPVGKKLKEQYLRTSEDNSSIIAIAGYVLLFVVCLAYTAAQSVPSMMLFRF